MVTTAELMSFLVKNSGDLIENDLSLLENPFKISSSISNRKDLKTQCSYLSCCMNFVANSIKYNSYE